MAEFLVECMLADALLLGQCGAQEPMQTHQDAQDASIKTSAASLSKTEMRRRRNREWMQKTRQAERENIERMRTTVQTLTQYLELMVETQRYCQSPFEEKTHRLQTEKQQLQQALHQHLNSRLRLGELLALEQPSASHDADQRTGPSAQDAAAVFSEYKPITHTQAHAAIKASYQGITEFGQFAQPLSRWISDAHTPARTFGWAVACALRPGCSFYLDMTKALEGVSAQEAMQRSWSAFSRPYVADKSPSQRLVRSILLQELDSSTSVMGSDWHHPLKPGVCMRSITVRTCVVKDNGYALSLGTLNPQDPELRRRAPQGVEYVDSLTWYDFTDNSDGSGCVASLKILWHYDTKENLHTRLVNALSLARRWESEVIQRPLRLLQL